MRVAHLKSRIALDEARDALQHACGLEAMIDTAAVVANFQRMVRIADSTGIPLDTGMTGMTTALREELGINEFASASNTPPSDGWLQFTGQLLGGAVHGVLKAIGMLRRVTGRTRRTYRNRPATVGDRPAS